MGAAVGKVVSGVVDDLIMPVVGVVLPGGDWRNAQVVLSGNNAIKYGDFVGRLVDFVIVALVVFAIVKGLLAEKAKPSGPPTTKECTQCLEVVPVAARKCRACASPLTA